MILNKKEKQLMNFIDMHTHSTASDGIYSPRKLVDYAIEKGLAGIAITDHDTIDGIEEAIQQARHYKNFIIIPGVELSTEYNNEEVHVLGYMINYKNRYLLKLLNNLQTERNNRALKIIDKLTNLGFEINYEDIERIAGPGTIGRPHIARALIHKGYVKNNEEAFKKYLSKGCPAYVPRQKLTPRDAIDIIRESGGVSVAAHPGLLECMITLDYLVEIGIDGIEVYHPDHTIDKSLKYLELAKKHNLIVTAGSDFHYPPNNNKYHGDLGSTKIPLKSIQVLFK